MGASGIWALLFGANAGRSWFWEQQHSALFRESIGSVASENLLSVIRADPSRVPAGRVLGVETTTSSITLIPPFWIATLPEERLTTKIEVPSGQNWIDVIMQACC